MNNSQDNQKQIAELRNQAATWMNRAYMAYGMNNIVLSQQALTRSWEMQKGAAALDGTVLPPVPPAAEVYFRERYKDSPPDQGWNDRNQPALIPLRPYPFDGSNEVALPEPEPNRDSDA